MMTHRQDMLDLLENAFRDKGILMVLISQSFPAAAVGEAQRGKDMTEIFQRCGIVPGLDMTLPAALTKLALILQMTEKSIDEKMKLLGQNWEGEIS